MQRFSFYEFFICAWWLKRIKISVLENLSLFVVRLHVKGRFQVKYLSSRNEISDFDTYTAIDLECACCHLRIASQENYNLDSFWISSSASLEWICHGGTSGVAQARQHILTFNERSAKTVNLYYVPRTHAILAATKDVHSTATVCKSLTFFTTIMQPIQSAHIAWLHPVLWLLFQINQFTRKRNSLELFENEICTFFPPLPSCILTSWKVSSQNHFTSLRSWVPKQQRNIYENNCAPILKTSF